MHGTPVCPEPTEPIARRGDPAELEREIAALPEPAILAQRGRFSVALAPAEPIPAVLAEIGRLREQTFRAVGEGTGRAFDLDAYDRAYQHLFVWDAEEREVVGAYRLCSTDLLQREGRRLGARSEPEASVVGTSPLYTQTLFELEPRFFAELGPAIELGRAFVQDRYQRKACGLPLLWRGIGRLISREPRYRRLFGAVSISADYTPASRALIVSTLRAHYGEPALARFVRPRLSAEIGLGAAATVTDLATLGTRVSELEPDGKAPPMLIREYAKLGGRFLAFHRDPDFGNTIDALSVVDLAHCSPRILGLHMGHPAALRFLAYHRTADAALEPAQAPAA
jgi:putative hemolysin